MVPLFLLIPNSTLLIELDDSNSTPPPAPKQGSSISGRTFHCLIMGRSCSNYQPIKERNYDDFHQSRSSSQIITKLKTKATNICPVPYNFVNILPDFTFFVDLRH